METGESFAPCNPVFHMARPRSAKGQLAGWLQNPENDSMHCRVGCGACCVAPSISEPIPGMNGGKPAGVRCIHLAPDRLCGLFGHPDRPKVCDRLQASPEMCGQNATEALAYLAWLERETKPEG